MNESCQFPPAGPTAARVALGALIVAGQLLLLVPAYLLWIIGLYAGGAVAGQAGMLIALSCVAAFLIGMSYPVALLATFVVSSLARRPTFFSASYIARRTALGFLIGFLALGAFVALIAAFDRVAPGIITSTGPLSDIGVAIEVLLVVVPPLIAIGKATGRHSDSV
jgi:hypothetical protein